MSITVKFLLVLLLTVGLTVAAGFIAAYQLRTMLLRKTAQAVTEQVVAFRSWVSSAGTIWVDSLQPSAPDYLSRTSCGPRTFYSKNPALATRELSTIVAHSGVHASFRVTSDNYRNAQNKPDAFETRAISAFKTGLLLPPQEHPPFVETYEGNRYRYAVPVIVTETCLRCHGLPQNAPKEVIDKYGAERAFHYQLGDVRGVITVDLPVTSLFTDSPILNLWSMALIVLALLINVALFRSVVVKRIEALTAEAEKIAEQEFGEGRPASSRHGSSDEIDRLSAACENLKERAKAALDRLKANR